MSRGRGQTLVLFALTLVLLAVLVLMTLGLGMRVKERMELQTLADTAAYSNAVAAARTFNVMAVMNRTEWSLLAAQSASHAYLSWATVYRGAVEGLRDEALPGLRQQCPDPASRVELDAVALGLEAELARVERLWSLAEPAAHEELRRLGEVQREVTEEDMRRNYARLEELVARGAVAKAVLEHARPASRWPLRASEAETPRNLEELSRDCETGVACDLGAPDFLDTRRNLTILRHQHELYLGTRGDAFTTAHEDRRGVLVGRLGALLGGAGVSYVGKGTSYRSHITWTHGTDHARGPGNAEYPQEAPFDAFSDDHGMLSVRKTFLAGCSARTRLPLRVHLKSAADPDENEHRWISGGTHHRCAFQRDASHTLPNLGVARSWPLIIDFNDKTVAEQVDLFGQPVLDVRLVREYGAGAPRADPWERRFSLGGARLDTRPRGPRDSDQAAVARAIAYYHRGGHWPEPPNFMNPFWRATLLSSKGERP
jgi:hypothetical protein